MSTTLKIRVSDEPISAGVFSLANKGLEPKTQRIRIGDKVDPPSVASVRWSGE